MNVNSFTLEALITYAQKEIESLKNYAMTNIDENQLMMIRGSYTTYKNILEKIAEFQKKAKEMIEKQND